MASASDLKDDCTEPVTKTAQAEIPQKKSRPNLRDIIIGKRIDSAIFGIGWMSSNIINEVPSYPGFEVVSSSSGWDVQAFFNYFPSTKLALGLSYNDRRITNELSYKGSSFNRIVENSPVELSARYYPFDFKHIFYAGIAGKLLYVDGNYQMGGQKFYNYGAGLHRVVMFGGDIPLSSFTGKIAGFDFGARVEYQILDDRITSPLPEIGNVKFREENRWLLQATFSFDWGDWSTGY